MIKVLIVDDEILARIGIKSLIPWEENGFEIIGECDNGKVALQMAKEKQPDIIISDVKMPIMNGIELIQAIKQEELDIKFVMLSAYDEFNLVKEAMKQGAEDYILKLKLEPNEMLTILNKIKKKINQNSKRNTNNRHSNMNTEGILREKKIRDVIYGLVCDEELIRNEFKDYKVKLSCQYLCCLSIKIEESENINEFREVFIAILKEIANNHGENEIVEGEFNTYSIVCSLYATSTFEQEQSLKRMGQAIYEFANNSMNLSVCIGIGKIYNGFNELKSSYQQSIMAIKHRFANQKSNIIFYNKISETNIETVDNEFDAKMRELVEALKTNEVSSIQTAFNNMINYLKQTPNITESYLMGKTYILIFIIDDFIDDNNICATDIWGDVENQYTKLIKLKSIIEYIDWIEKIGQNVMELLQQTNGGNTTILRAKQYVRRNISESISLQNISDYLEISPNYFSKVFSEETGQRFIDYVNQERVNLAKEMLRTTNQKTYEIAEAVGFENVYYFSRVFKKMTGKSPTSYKAGKS